MKPAARAILCAALIFFIVMSAAATVGVFVFDHYEMVWERGASLEVLLLLALGGAILVGAFTGVGVWISRTERLRRPRMVYFQDRRHP